MKVKVIKKTQNELPAYETLGSSGMDVRADLWEVKENFLFNAEVIRKEDQTIDAIRIHPGGRALIPTGLYMKIPDDYECQVRPRSGLALKHGITVLNTPGTIDSDYTLEVGVILINFGNSDFDVKQGDRIAQLVFNKSKRITWKQVESLENTSRTGGFGSTGV